MALVGVPGPRQRMVAVGRGALADGVELMNLHFECCPLGGQVTDFFAPLAPACVQLLRSSRCVPTRDGRFVRPAEAVVLATSEAGLAAALVEAAEAADNAPAMDADAADKAAEAEPALSAPAKPYRIKRRSLSAAAAPPAMSATAAPVTDDPAATAALPQRTRDDSKSSG